MSSEPTGEPNPFSKEAADAGRDRRLPTYAAPEMADISDQVPFVTFSGDTEDGSEQRGLYAGRYFIPTYPVTPEDNGPLEVKLVTAGLGTDNMRTVEVVRGEAVTPFAIGEPLNVLRTGAAAPEEGWTVDAVETTDDGIMVVTARKEGVGTKKMPASWFRLMNPPAPGRSAPDTYTAAVAAARGVIEPSAVGGLSAHESFAGPMPERLGFDRATVQEEIGEEAVGVVVEEPNHEVDANHPTIEKSNEPSELETLNNEEAQLLAKMNEMSGVLSPKDQTALWRYAVALPGPEMTHAHQQLSFGLDKLVDIAAYRRLQQELNAVRANQRKLTEQ